MSVKHIKEYYDKVVTDYMDMKYTLEEMNDMLKNNPELQLPNVENIRQMVSKLKENYMRISYIIYLLNMPNKKEKKKKYIRQYENKVNKIPKEHTLEGVINENKECVDNVKECVKN